MKNTKILLYGGKSTAFIVYEMLKDENKKVNFIFDHFLKNLLSNTMRYFHLIKKIYLILLKKVIFFLYVLECWMGN